MFLIIKSLSGVDFEINKKVYSLKGNAFLNQISNEDYAELKQHSAFVDMLEKGFIIVNDTKLSNDSIKSDVVSEVSNTQEKDIEKHSKKGVKVKREK